VDSTQYTPDPGAYRHRPPSDCWAAGEHRGHRMVGYWESVGPVSHRV